MQLRKIASLRGLEDPAAPLTPCAAGGRGDRADPAGGDRPGVSDDGSGLPVPRPSGA